MICPRVVKTLWSLVWADRLTHKVKTEHPLTSGMDDTAVRVVQYLLKYFFYVYVWLMSIVKLGGGENRSIFHNSKLISITFRVGQSRNFIGGFNFISEYIPETNSWEFLYQIPIHKDLFVFMIVWNKCSNSYVLISFPDTHFLLFDCTRHHFQLSFLVHN